MKVSKLLLATAGATVLLAALVGSSSARVFSTSSQTFRVAFRTVTLNGVFGNIRCPLTLEGSFHSRAIAKVAGSLIGYITAGVEGTCETSRATLLGETLPWHMQYASFTGTLPNITSIRVNVIGVSLRIQEPLAACLLRSEAGRPMMLSFSREPSTRTLTTVEFSGTVPTDCGIEVSYTSGREPVTVLNAVTRITVTLI